MFVAQQPADPGQVTRVSPAVSLSTCVKCGPWWSLQSTVYSLHCSNVFLPDDTSAVRPLSTIIFGSQNTSEVHIQFFKLVNWASELLGPVSGILSCWDQNILWCLYENILACWGQNFNFNFLFLFHSITSLYSPGPPWSVVKIRSFLN